MVEPSSIALSELRSSPDAAEGAEQRNEAPAAGATVPADTPGAAEEFKTAELHAYVSKLVQAQLSSAECRKARCRVQCRFCRL